MIRPNKRPIQEDLFDNIDSEHKAYVLGVLASDGYVNLKGNIKLAVQHSDREWLNDIQKVIFTDNEDNIKYYLLPTDKRTGKRYERATLQFRNVHMSSKLFDYGFSNQKSVNLKYPNVILESSLDLQRHFIRGYFDGDGSICRKTEKTNDYYLGMMVTNEFGTTLRNVIIQALSIELGLRKCGKSDKNVFELRTQKHDNIKLFLDWLYKDSSIYLVRKYCKYQEFLSTIKEKAPDSSSGAFSGIIQSVD